MFVFLPLGLAFSSLADPCTVNVGGSNWIACRASELAGIELQDFQTAKVFPKDGSALPSYCMHQTVPGTVLTGLLANGTFASLGVFNDDSVWMGSNLNTLPQIEDVGKSFYTFWFRTNLPSPPQACANQATQARLDFHGINYRADVLVNGNAVANSSSIAGMFNRHRNIPLKTSTPTKGAVMAVKVLPLDKPGICLLGYIPTIKSLHICAHVVHRILYAAQS